MTASLFRTSFVLCALLADSPASLAGQDKLRLPIPAGWEVGYHAETKTAMIIEFVRRGETVNNWSELVTLQQFASVEPPVSSRQLYDMLRTIREARCPGVTVWGPVDEDANSVLYEWKAIDECEGFGPQSEIARFIMGRDTVYRVAFTTRAELTDEMRATWTVWLRSLTLDD